MQEDFDNLLVAASENISALCTIMNIKVEQLRPVHLRRADKYLSTAELLFDNRFAQRCATAKRRRDATFTLQRKIHVMKHLANKATSYANEAAEFQVELKLWNAMENGWKEQFLSTARLAKQYFEAKLYNSELEIIHRYERFQALKGILPYADNAQFLCEAIYHYENREKYETNKEKTIERRESALVRLQTVKRGLYLSLLLCLLVVTLPLCAPFAYSLYQRKREVESQIANLEESLRRENKRIEAADEGVIAAQEIRETLGPVSLESVRHTLNEVADLRREFMSSSPQSSATAHLIAFIEREERHLRECFGTAPTQMTEKFHWIAERASQLELLIEKIEQLNDSAQAVSQKMSRQLNGHSLNFVLDSFLQLESECKNEPLNNLPDWLLEEFVEAGMRLPVILGDTRELLWRISKGLVVEDSIWKRMELRLQAQHNVLQAALLERTLQQHDFLHQEKTFNDKINALKTSSEKTAILSSEKN